MQHSTPSPDRRVALVTGASSGFGLLTSVELATRGFRVFASLRDLGRASHLERAAAAAGVKVEKVELDVTRPNSITATLEQIERRAGGLDVLVNNAGFGLGGFFEDLELSELREQMETNFFGAAAVLKAVIPSMRERRRGRLINVSSVNGRIAAPGLSAYSASKFALEGLCEALRYELAPFGIAVVIVEPGTFRTEIFARNRRVARRASDPASPYYEMTQAMTRHIDRRMARSHADPRQVASAIGELATVERPPLRRVVGREAHVAAAARALLPDSVFARALNRALRWSPEGAR
jgi:NAD(P)-dependent dehydrogenase (short-subunit alcohol dehydrogenase family)